MKNIFACALFICLSATTSLAGDPQDVATGRIGKQPIRSTKFGTCVQTKWSASSDVCAPAPEVKAEPAPAPEPIPTPQPVAQLGHEQLTIYFTFNKSAITKESAEKLNQIADAVNHSPKVTKVNIVGYTDEIGTHKYNNKLSVKRAHAVKQYLDTKMRIDASVLGLRGLGAQDPVVDCKKSKKRAQKIVCMAKDRRVEVEFEFEK